MATHVKVLAVIHIVLGVLGLLAAFVVLVFFGGLAALAGVAPDHDAHIAVPVLGGIGGIIALVVVLLSVPGIVAGAGLLGFRPWARVLTIVLSALHLINVPLGTALGVYGLWALLNRQTESLFPRS